MVNKIRTDVRFLYHFPALMKNKMPKVLNRFLGRNMVGQGTTHKVNHIGPSGISQIQISEEEYQLMKKAFGKVK